MSNDNFFDDGLELAAHRQAEEFVDQAWDATRPVERRKFARKALNLNLDCIDAYVVLAIESQSLAEKIALLKEGISVGDRIWATELEDSDFPWWGVMETRPYMRAMHNLGLEFQNAERDSEAEQIYNRMLVMNPNDNTGIRYLLLGLWTAQGDLKKCTSLLKDYPDDYGLEAMMTTLLIKLSQSNTTGLTKMFAELTERNEYVLPLLAIALGKNRWPKSSVQMIAVGSKDEANSYLHEHKDGWLLAGKIGALFLRDYGEWTGK